MKKFYGIWRFITMFTRTHHWLIWIQSTPSYPISSRFLLILSSHLCLCIMSGLFPSGFATKYHAHFKSLLCVLYALFTNVFRIFEVLCIAICFCSIFSTESLSQVPPPYQANCTTLQQPYVRHHSLFCLSNFYSLLLERGLLMKSRNDKQQMKLAHKTFSEEYWK
jgi:hypothetical protein